MIRAVITLPLRQHPAAAETPSAPPPAPTAEVAATAPAAAAEPEVGVGAVVKAAKEGRMTEPVVVLIVGLPSAGKSVLIDRAAGSPDWTVLDPDRFRRRLPPALRRVPGPYPLYVLAMVVAIARHTHVVVESRGTYAWLRRLVTVCACARGREAVLVLLDAPSRDAVAGQRRRGRVAPQRVMRWHTTCWTRLLDAASSGALAAEGWDRVRLLDRPRASDVEDLAELVGRPM